MTETAVYVWRGVNRLGRNANGELSARSRGAARDTLRRQGIAVRRVYRKRIPGTSKAWRMSRRIKATDIALFSRQLATMMRAGVPLVRAFEVVGRSARNPALAAVIGAVGQEVSEGASLAAALGKYPRIFDELYVALVGVGEQSGALEPMLERIATYHERTVATRRKLAKAMTYPAVVVLAAVLVTTLLLIYVVPQFETVFAGVGADLPAFTQFVIGISDGIREHWPIWLGVAAGCGIGIGAAGRRSPAFRSFYDRCIGKAPLAGQIVVKASVARFARTLATSVAAGMPLVDALHAVVDTTGNTVYRRAIKRLRHEVAAGRPLAASMLECRVFPDIVVQMVAIGEESGNLDDMLARAATHFEDQLDTAVDNLTALVEPLLMAVLGVVVGGLVVAMYLPVFQLGTAFAG